MALHFIEEGSYDKILIQLAKQNNSEQENLYELLNHPDKYHYQKICVSNWLEIQESINQSQQDLLFVDDDLQTTKCYIVDINKILLESDIKHIQYLQNNDSGKDLIVYRSEIDSWSADEKKLLKKYNISLLNLKKIDIVLASRLFHNYLDSAQQDDQIRLLSSANQSMLISQSSSYQEIIDKLDLLSLTDDPNLNLHLVTSSNELPIFMLRFDVDKIHTQYKSWLNAINDDNLQLAISLILTKLEKGSNSFLSRKFFDELIQLDLTLKTNNNVSSITFWKLFLWKCKKIVS
jgi:hypothetical protein